VRGAAAGCWTAVVLALAPGLASAADGESVVATITDRRLSESSGMVQSTADPELAYIVNDSGNAPVVHVVELATGNVVGTARLAAQLVDSEALAIGADERLYVADIGDNAAVPRALRRRPPRRRGPGLRRRGRLLPHRHQGAVRR
jgi:hypothetical protein